MPSTLAASMNSSGNVTKYWRIMKMPKASTRNGRISPAYVLVSLSWVVTTCRGIMMASNGIIMVAMISMNTRSRPGKVNLERLSDR